MDVKKFLSEFYKGTKKQTLGTVIYFMKKYNNPEKSLKIIHIAGTNGKGSCVEMISNVLTCAKYKVGKFISPHLVEYNERICVNNKEITDTELEKLITELMPEVEKYNKEHIANLFVICILKPLYSINDIATMIKSATKTIPMQIIYNNFCNELEDAISAIFAGKEYIPEEQTTFDKYVLKEVMYVKSGAYSTSFFMV